MTVRQKPRPERVLHMADVLNKLGHSRAQNLLLRLATRDPRLAQALRLVMFRFADLVQVRDRSFQVLYAAIERDTWLLAMRSAPDAIRTKLLANLSVRARAMFTDDLDTMSKQRRSDVEQAQAQIVATALRLEREGKVYIDRPGAPEVYV